MSVVDALRLALWLLIVGGAFLATAGILWAIIGLDSRRRRPR